MDTMDLGFPLSLDEDIAGFVQQTSVQLQPGDGVVLYTNGLTEAANGAGELYGLARLYTVVRRHWGQSAVELHLSQPCIVPMFL
jgi:serine phosphatase RsbU (regulator of sigma subunit)